MRHWQTAQQKTAWPVQAAKNVRLILPFLLDPGDDTPVDPLDKLVERITKAFPDRESWNKAVHECQQLEPEEKLWLVVV